MNDPTSGLIDIIGPVGPVLDATSYSAWWLVLGVATLVLLGVWMRWRGRCVRACRKRLQQLRQACAAGRVSQHEAAYRLAFELRQGLQLQQLNADQPPPALPIAEHPDWADSVTRLDTLRYQAGASLDDSQWTRLFNQADIWLQRAGRC
ncbi:hypothetical protein TPL01_03050 [Sulfuriferula plumbiphila]|uniref:DUF4381 domain-containing protein n=1 Tax=Sulfuriferula plumbiphila TaxID=171865 RepID=A0A512L3X3_9PROT|nr:hypothetical protein [Sulfuriferula plumbiphila]BBP05536.1 hypothetical protein SFPGR_29580 [Sulfuriferula plumbiphila]GEP29167.1 hypothetical protein TPL01_03050 [Sulfuriferula plumbiphila]